MRKALGPGVFEPVHGTHRVRFLMLQKHNTHRINHFPLLAKAGVQPGEPSDGNRKSLFLFTITKQSGKPQHKKNPARNPDGVVME